MDPWDAPDNRPAGGTLVRVIAIGKTLDYSGGTIEFICAEIREEFCRIHWRLAGAPVPSFLGGPMLERMLNPAGPFSASASDGTALNVHRETSSGSEHEAWGVVILWPVPTTGSIEVSVAPMRLGDNPVMLPIPIGT